MLDKFSNDKVHSHEVERLSLMIFDEVSTKIKPMPDKYREYLDCAALLHDIGYYVEAKSHNRHSQKMILDYGLEEFSEKECEIISCIARYHRGSLPDKKEHDVYCNLDKKERKIVKRLGGILRIADNLDTNHVKLIDKIDINYDEIDNITEMIITPSNRDYLPDLTYVIRKRDLFEIGFKTQVIFKFKHD